MLIWDIRSFRTLYGLAANDPKMLLVRTTDPGFVSDDEIEANLDLEWAGAIAPNATTWCLYGTDAFTAMIDAVELNVAPVISVGRNELAHVRFRAIVYSGGGLE